MKLAFGFCAVLVLAICVSNTLAFVDWDVINEPIDEYGGVYDTSALLEYAVTSGGFDSDEAELKRGYNDGDDHDNMAVYNGVVMQNAGLHRVNLSQPQDANAIDIDILGPASQGSMQLNMSGPVGYCPYPINQPNSCGRSVQDLGVSVKVHNGRAKSYTWVNNPVAGVIGTVYNYTAHLYRTNDELKYRSSHKVYIPSRATFVPINQIIAGELKPSLQINKKYDLKGKLFSFVAPNTGSQFGGIDPYQFMFVMGNIDTANDNSSLAGYRVESPVNVTRALGAACKTTNVGFPASTMPVSGLVNNFSIKNNLVTGKISLQSVSPIGYIKWFTGTLSGVWTWVDRRGGLGMIDVGLVVDDANPSTAYVVHQAYVNEVKRVHY